MSNGRELFDAYRVYPRQDGIHYELAGRLVVENDQLRILFHQYGNLHAVLEAGPISPQTRGRMEKYSNGYYHLSQVERFARAEMLAPL